MERARSYRGPPPGADPQLWQWFSSVDTDRSGAITANELQSALVNGESQKVLLDNIDSQAGALAGNWTS